MTGVGSASITGSPASLPTGWSLVGGVLAGPGAVVGTSFFNGPVAGANLSHMNLSSVTLPTDLRGVDFSGSNLSAVDLSGHDLTDAVFTGATGIWSTAISDGTIFSHTTCVDGVVVSAPYTCAGHGFGS